MASAAHYSCHLVTGGAGFIGSHLVDRLIARGERVICVDDFNDFYSRSVKEYNIHRHRNHPCYRLVEADIRDVDQLARLFADFRFQKVFHLAARAGVRPSIQSPLLYEQVNVRGTLNLLEESRKNGVQQFIFASSSSVYGARTKIAFREDDPVSRPISPYGATKVGGELLCHTYHHLYGLPTTVLRFFSVYGPRQRPDMAIHKFYRVIVEDRPVPLFGDGSMARNYTYIDDIIDGVLAAAAKPSPFDVFNLGASASLSLSDLVIELARVSGRDVRVERLPAPPGDVEWTFADISKARALLGYSPITSIRDGLAKFVHWFDEHFLKVFPLSQKGS